MRVGQPARISLDAYPELEFKGRVEQVAPAGCPEPPYRKGAQLR
jgi:multidrug resistance efflux pump